MSRPCSFQMDVGRRFAHLPKAPIVEALIQWQASPSKGLNLDELKKSLAARFPGYSVHAQQQVEVALSPSAQGMEARQRPRWGGLRLTSADDKYVCQFLANGILFSRLSPYETWSTFAAEAGRFWLAFVELAVPVEVERMAVRFISQLELKEGETATDFVEEPSGLPELMGLRQDTFFRQDIMQVPDYPYRVRLVRAIQGREPPIIPRRSLIVDIDVFTTQPTKVDQAAIDQRLKEMRFLKNLVFFSFVKDPLKRFGA